MRLFIIRLDYSGAEISKNYAAVDFAKAVVIATIKIARTKLSAILLVSPIMKIFSVGRDFTKPGILSSRKIMIYLRYDGFRQK